MPAARSQRGERRGSRSVAFARSPFPRARGARGVAREGTCRPKACLKGAQEDKLCVRSTACGHSSRCTCVRLAGRRGVCSSGCSDTTSHAADSRYSVYLTGLFALTRTAIGTLETVLQTCPWLSENGRAKPGHACLSASSWQRHTFPTRPFFPTPPPFPALCLGNSRPRSWRPRPLSVL